MNLIAAIAHALRPKPHQQPWPYGRTLIHFDARGCMAQDWRESDRGVIVDRDSRKVYGSGSRKIDYWVVRRPDGSTFEAYQGYCQPGEQYMEGHTDNPDENLTDKMVYVT